MSISFKQRCDITHILVARHSATSKKVYYVAMLSSAGEYFEYEITMRQNGVTAFVSDRIRQMFSDFQLSSKTKVCLLGDVPEDSPMAIYLRLVGQQLMFNVIRAPVEKMLGRISRLNMTYLHKYRNGRYVGEAKGGMPTLGRLWDKLVEHRRCPWITAEYSKWLDDNVGRQRRVAKRLVRIGIYYMTVKDARRKKRSAETRGGTAS